MAVADLGITTVVSISAITGVLHGGDAFVRHPILCEFIVTIGILCVITSIGSILILSFHRFVVICFFTQRHRLFTKRSSSVMIAMIWLYGFAANFRYIMRWGANGHAFDHKLEQCFYDRKTSSWFLRILAVVTLVGVTVFYAGMFDFVRRHKKRMLNLSVNKELANSIKLAHTLMLMVVAYCICSMPYAIVVILDKADNFQQEVYLLTIMLLYVSSAINWIIYGLSNRQFRAAFKRTLMRTK